MMEEKSLHNTDVNVAKKNVKDIQTFGNGDLFTLISKASSENEGWMKSTKAMFTGTGCVIQVTTQQRNPDGSYAVAEALTYVPGVAWYDHADGYRFIGPIILDSSPDKASDLLYTNMKMNQAGFDANTMENTGLTKAEATINFFKNHAKHYVLKKDTEENTANQGTVQDFIEKAKAYYVESGNGQPPTTKFKTIVGV